MSVSLLRLLWLDHDADRVEVAAHWLAGALPGWQLEVVTGATALAAWAQRVGSGFGTGSGLTAAVLAWPLPWLGADELPTLRRLLGEAPTAVLLPTGLDSTALLATVQTLDALRPARHLTADLSSLGQLAGLLRSLSVPAAAMQPPTREPAHAPPPFPRTTGPIGRHLQVVAEPKLSTANTQVALAHDLQEPLRSVASYLQVLERQHGQQLPEDGKVLVDKARTAAQRMAARVRTLVDAPVAASSCDGDATLQHVVSDLSALLTERHVQVQYATLGPLPLPTEVVARVLQNLLANAAKHGKRGGVVRVTAKRSDDAVLLRVADDGPGVAPADRERLFDWRARGQTTADGHGVGLAAVAALLAQHGGRIWLDTEVAVGATFCVSIPSGTTSTGQSAAFS